MNAQITALEEFHTHSEAAVQLVEATLAAASPTEMLEMARLFIEGLLQFKNHGVPLKQCRVSNMMIRLKQSFEARAAGILGNRHAGHGCC